MKEHATTISSQRSEEWAFFSHLILRSAGFPLGWLEKISFPETVRLLQEQERLQAQWQEKSQIILEKLNQVTALPRKDRKRIRKALLCYQLPVQGEGHPLFWSTVGEKDYSVMTQWAKQLKAITEQLATAFDQELQQNRKQLREMFLQREALQEAVFISSSTAYEQGLKLLLEKELPANRPKKQRHKEQLAAIYLQRFTSKNETASYFGPANYGTFSSQSGQLQVETEGTLRRGLFMAYWAVQALADKMAEDREVQPYLRPKLSPFVRLEQGAVCMVSTGKTMPLPLPFMHLLQAMDGRRTVEEISESVGLPVTKALQVLQKLKQKRLVLLEVDFPTSVFEPFAFLIKKVEALPEACASKAEWLEKLDRFTELLDQWHASPSFAERKATVTRMEQVFQEVTEISARKDEGKHYTDRTIVYEEARGDVSELTVGKELQQAWKERLSPVFRLLLCRAEVMHRAYTSFAYQEYQGFSEAPSFLTFALHMQERKADAVAFAEAEVRAFDQQVADWMTSHRNQQGEIVLTEQQVEQFCQAYPQPRWAIFSPDVMIAASSPDEITEGNDQLVLGEVHSGLQIWTVIDSMFDERDRLDREIYQGLGAELAAYWLEHVGPRAPGKTFRPELSGGRTVENLGRSFKEREQVISIADLGLVYEEGRFFVTENQQRRIMDLETDVEPLNQIFSFPCVQSFSVDTGEHTPRIVINDVVFQRERWRLSCEELLASLPRERDWTWIAWAKAWRKDYGIPRFIYARGNQEPKPIYVDLDHFFLIELLVQILNRNETVVISEMMPAPDALWFERNGEKHTSEFRFSVLHESERRERS